MSFHDRTTPLWSAFRKPRKERFARRFAATLVVTCLISRLFSGPAAADEAAPTKTDADVRLGHSVHGEAFNEGPRQAARLMEGLLGPTFPTSTLSPLTQQFIDQGVSQLHGFWYFEAERSFRHAAAIDPDLAIAYWGMAMANQNTPERAWGFAKEAERRKDRASPRERRYVEVVYEYFKSWDDDRRRREEATKAEKGGKPAVDAKEAERRAKEATKERKQARIRNWEQVFEEFPDDAHARAFLAYQLWEDRVDLPIVSRHAVDALLELTFQQNPLHPAHHFRVHLWDDAKPTLALNSAARCGFASPGIAHMWHMPGHTYDKTKRYFDAAYHQEASARVDHAYMIRDAVFPYEIHNYAHNNEWCVRTNINLGRRATAVAMAKNLIMVPRHPEKNAVSKGGKAASFGRDRLWESLVAFEDWPALVSCAEGPFFKEADASPDDELRRRKQLAFALFLLGDADRAEEHLAWIVEQGRIASQRVAVEVPADAIRPNRPEATSLLAADALHPENGAGESSSEAPTRWDHAAAYVRAARDWANHDDWGALEEMNAAGDVPAEFAIRARILAGRHDDAVERARKHANSSQGEVLPQAALVEAMWAANDREGARKEFEKLRAWAGEADLTCAPLARLASIAAALGHPVDWRIAPKPAADILKRPALESLGPLEWSPPPAPHWHGQSAEGREIAWPGQYRSRAVVVVFYLGGGCLHCVDQLKKFAPMTEQFSAAGIDLVGVSTDPPDTHLDAWNRFAKDRPFPFPLVTDAPLNIFRQFRCFDDFERKPLHGTFLLDPAGRIRWRTIGAEPFEQPEFLLKEAKRLLAIDNPSPNPAGPEPTRGLPSTARATSPRSAIAGSSQ